MTSRRMRGFTLFELMITVAIVGVLAAVAVPNLGMFIKNNRLKGHTFEVVNALNIARTEAVKRKVTVAICNPNTANTGCNSTSDWTSGWVVFSDADENGTYTSSEILAQGQPAPGTAELQATGLTSSRLSYNSDGTLLGTSTVKFAICDDRQDASNMQDNARQVNVSPVGRANIEQKTVNCNSPS